MKNDNIDVIIEIGGGTAFQHDSSLSFPNVHCTIWHNVAQSDEPVTHRTAQNCALPGLAQFLRIPELNRRKHTKGDAMKPSIWTLLLFILLSSACNESAKLGSDDDTGSDDSGNDSGGDIGDDSSDDSGGSDGNSLTASKIKEFCDLHCDHECTLDETTGNTAEGLYVCACPADQWYDFNQQGCVNQLATVEIAVNDDTVCTLQTNGASECLLYGYLETPSMQSDPTEKFKQLAVGNLNACGLRFDGKVNCWGYETPTVPNDRFLQIDMEENVACGIRQDGNITCWGDTASDEAAIPDGPFVQVDVASNRVCAVNMEGNLIYWNIFENSGPSVKKGSYQKVSCGTKGICGLTTDGDVDCYYDTYYGEYYEMMTFVEAPGEGTFRDISVGLETTCAVAENGDLNCWGYDGVGTFNPPSGAYTQVSVTDKFACAVNEGSSIACWPETGGGYNVLSSEQRFSQISAWGENVCGVLTDGSLRCAGRMGPKPDGEFVMVNVREGYACAIDTAGHLHCFGAETESPEGEFIDVAVSADSFDGGYQGCAIDTDNRVVCWGDTASVIEGVPEGAFKKVYALYKAACALDMENKLHCWGDETSCYPTTVSDAEYASLGIPTFCVHSFGVLMDGTIGDISNSTANPQPIPNAPVYTADMPEEERFVAIGRDEWDIYALRANGQLLQWNVHDENSSPIERWPGETFSQISISDTCCALRTDGKLRCWRSEQ